MLIGAFDHDEDNAKHLEARKTVRSLMQDSEITIAITPLIRYEVLRKVTRVSPQQMQEILDGFESFDIDKTISDRASEIWRKGQQSWENKEKRNFDIFHYSVSDVLNLEWVSNDRDLKNIEKIAKSCI